MRITFAFFIDTLMVQDIDSKFAGGMKYLEGSIVFQNYSNVRNSSVCIVEESKVSSFRL
jgi:hypothetical protein